MTELLPTPPLPDATAMILVRLPGLLKGCPWPGLAASRAGFALLVAHDVEHHVDPAHPGTASAACSTRSVRVLRMGQAAIVRKISIVAAPSASTDTDLTIPVR